MFKSPIWISFQEIQPCSNLKKTGYIAQIDLYLPENCAPWLSVTISKLVVIGFQY